MRFYDIIHTSLQRTSIEAANLQQAIERAQALDIKVDLFNTIFLEWIEAWLADSYDAETELRTKVVLQMIAQNIKTEERFENQLSFTNFQRWADCCSTFYEMFQDDFEI